MRYKNYNMWGLSTAEPRSANLSFLSFTPSERNGSMAWISPRLPRLCPAEIFIAAGLISSEVQHWFQPLIHCTNFIPVSKICLLEVFAY